MEGTRVVEHVSLNLLCPQGGCHLYLLMFALTWQVGQKEGGFSLFPPPSPSGLSKQGIPREILQSIPVQFLFFHPSILEPNFNLSICEVQHPGQLKSFFFIYVHVEEKLSFQFSDLVFGVRASFFPRSLRNH